MAKDMNRERALAALLDAPTLTAAAEAAGISRKTLYLYLQNDSEFAFEYRRQRELRALERSEQAAKEREAAIDTLRDMMNDTDVPAAIRFKAAEKLLEVGNAGWTNQYNTAQNAVDKHTGWTFN